jgi:hypothetical protein
MFRTSEAANCRQASTAALSIFLAAAGSRWGVASGHGSRCTFILLDHIHIA